MALPLQIQILDPRIGQEFPLPSYATEGSAGLDLCAALAEPLHLAPGQAELIPTGLKVWIEDPKRTGMLLPRSGKGHKLGLVLGNLVGLIDADYQGPLMISAWNRNPSGDPIIIRPGEQIAQLVIVDVQTPELVFVDHFEPTRRGEGGFGSTGR